MRAQRAGFGQDQESARKEAIVLRRRGALGNGAGYASVGSSRGILTYAVVWGSWSSGEQPATAAASPRTTRQRNVDGRRLSIEFWVDCLPRPPAEEDPTRRLFANLRGLDPSLD